MREACWWRTSPLALPWRLEPQAMTESITKLTGTLHKIGGHYLLTDETHQGDGGTGRGRGWGEGKSGIASRSWERWICAATPVTDASQFVRVSTVTHLGPGAAADPGAAAGAATPAQAPVGHGIALSATTIAIIGGVAVAATLGGPEDAGKLPGQGASPVQPVRFT